VKLPYVFRVHIFVLSVRNCISTVWGFVWHFRYWMCI